MTEVFDGADWNVTNSHDKTDLYTNNDRFIQPSSNIGRNASDVVHTKEAKRGNSISMDNPPELTGSGKFVSKRKGFHSDHLHDLGAIQLNNDIPITSMASLTIDHQNLFDLSQSPMNDELSPTLTRVSEQNKISPSSNSVGNGSAGNRNLFSTSPFSTNSLFSLGHYNNENSISPSQPVFYDQFPFLENQSSLWQNQTYSPFLNSTKGNASNNNQNKVSVDMPLADDLSPTNPISLTFGQNGLYGHSNDSFSNGINLGMQLNNLPLFDVSANNDTNSVQSFTNSSLIESTSKSYSPMGFAFNTNAMANKQGMLSSTFAPKHLSAQPNEFVPSSPDNLKNSHIAQTYNSVASLKANAQSAPLPINQMKTKGSKNQICRFFLQGTCSRGENCNFLHEAPMSFNTNSFTPMGSNVQFSQSINAPQFTKRTSPSNSASTEKSNVVSPRNKPTHRNPIPIVDDTLMLTDPSALKGRIYSMCKDQQGCRSLQRLLDENNESVTTMIFDEVIEHTVKLMSDPFGNYLCQKLLEHCNDDQRLAVVKSISNELVSISINMHGTRAAQKLIDLLKNPEEIEIVQKSLSDHVVKLIQDLNGNHVIQRCLNKLQPKYTQFIYDAVTQEGNVIAVATHRHGCCVLQRCIDSASEPQKLQLVNEVIRNALPLVKDPYGNYVVQYVLDLPFPEVPQRMVSFLKGHIAELSMQKFSSNVMEKIVTKSERDLGARNDIINEIILFDDIKSLILDPFANYVIQTCLKNSNEKQHEALVAKIRPHQTSLRNTPYGKKILNTLQKEIQ